MEQKTLPIFSLNGTNTANKSLKSIGHKVKSTATLVSLLPTPQASDFVGTVQEKNYSLRHLEHNSGWVKKQSSRAVFPVSPLAKLDEEKERQTTVTSGLKCLELYNLQNPHGSLLKMCVASLLGAKVWYSNKCALTWKAKVTKSNRLLFQLLPSMRPTEEIGSGLLPTARTSSKNGASQKEVEAGNPKRRLETEIAMLPTPRAGNPGSRPNGKGGKILNEEVGKGTGLKLRPNFAAWMMGYPLHWTDLNLPKHSIGQVN